MDFKERNGFKRVNLPRYFVPLTHTGRVAFHLGLQKRFIDHFPEPLLVKLRNARSLWYAMKLNLSKST